MDKRHEKPAAAPERLKRRADFVRAAKGQRFFARAFTLQAVPRTELAAVEAQAVSQIPTAARSEPLAPVRIGLTVTRQLGGAVKRNRIRRRLKEALRQFQPLPARPGYDYVLLARSEALVMPFTALQAEIGRAFSLIGIQKKRATEKWLPPGRDSAIRQEGNTAARRRPSKSRTPQE